MIKCLKKYWLPAVWIFIGIARFIATLSVYTDYSRGGFYSFKISDAEIAENLVASAIYIYIGVLIVLNPKKIILELYTFILWVCSFSVIWTFIYYIEWSHFDIGYFVLFDYLIIPLIIVTLMHLKKSGLISKEVSFSSIVAGNYKKLVLEVVCFNLLIYMIEIIL